MPLPIEDYALIGNTLTSALVGKNGSIDWLCMPRFDSGACFAALLGEPDNGYWRIAPGDEVRAVRRRYRDRTLILETEFETDNGKVVIADFMPIAESRQQVDVIRIITGVRGTVPMRMEIAFRFDYGRTVPWVTQKNYGLRAIAGPDAIKLRTPVRMHGEGLTTVADFHVTAGRSVPFTMTWYPSPEREPGEKHPMRTLTATEKWWQEWSSKFNSDCGPWRDLTLRSLITLKALTFRPTGAIVAAPTTSLPEWIGGERNWDYRFCWLRDATFTLYALLISGYTDEAQQWREWLLRAIAGRPEELQIMYGLGGERRLVELEAPWLKGYQDSRPVRLGNAAHEQFQLDVYGEVLDTAHLGRRFKMKEIDDGWRVQCALVDYLESAWNKPDEGIWEVRGGRRHFTHSKVMAWVAVDRMVKAVEKFNCDGDAVRWRALRDRIHRDVCEKGFDSERNAFMQSYGSKDLDASVLLIPMVGFLPAKDPRMVSTIEAIQRELMVDGLVMRYQTHNTVVDGLPPGEGAFLPCSFWLADNLAMLGRKREARELLEKLTSLCNDVGLYSEEYDPVARRMLGNFPQAFTHVSLVNTVHNLTTREGPARHRAR